MSRSLQVVCLPFLTGLVANVPLVHAQDTQAGASRTVTADEVFRRAEEAYGPPAPEVKCEPQEGDEIVVCADEPDDPDRYRIGSSLEQGDDSHLSRDARAPDFAAPPCVPSLLTLCPKFGSPPPPAYMIDFSTLPETPAGSDAERVGQGLAPLEEGGRPAAETAREGVPE